MAERLVCPNCSAKTPSDSQYCSFCGTALTPQAATKTVETMESSLIFDLVTCQQCGAPMEYRGNMKEVIACDYCGATNIVYDRVAAMKETLLGLYAMVDKEANPLAKEIREHKMKKLREYTERKNVPSFESIPDFEEIVREYIKMKFRLQEVSLHFASENGGIQYLSEYTELSGFSTGTYRELHALGLCLFHREIFSRASEIAQIIASYYGYPVKVMVRDGPGPVLISAGPILVAIDNKIKQNELIVATALAKKGAVDFDTGVEDLPLTCAQVWHGQHATQSSYWYQRIKGEITYKETFPKVTIRGLKNRGYYNHPWGDTITNEERSSLSKTAHSIAESIFSPSRAPRRPTSIRWYLTPQGLQALRGYKRSLEKAELPIPPILKEIHSL